MDFRIYYTDPKEHPRRLPVITTVSLSVILVPMRAEIFPTHIHSWQGTSIPTLIPSRYCDLKHSLGERPTSLADRSVSDSLGRRPLFVPKILIRMPQSFGQKFYEETINNPSSFASQDAFNKFFPGLYVTTTYGSGNIISFQVQNWTSIIVIHER